MNRLCLLFFAALVTLSASLETYSQDPEPEAYLRINTVWSKSDSRYVETETVAEYYYVEIYMPHPLEEKIYNQLKNNAVRVGGIAQGHKELPYRLQVSPDDCRGGPCARTHFRVYLPQTLDLSKTYEIFFDSYATAAGDTLRYRAIPVRSDYQTSLVDKSGLCGDSLAIEVGYEPDRSKTPLKVRTPIDQAVLLEYIEARISRAYDWLSGLTQAELNLVEFRVRPLNSLIKPPQGQNYDTWSPSESDLPRLSVTSLKPAQDSKTRAVNSQFVLSCIVTREHLPTESFNAKLSLPINPPRELQRPLTKTGLAGLTSISSPGKPATSEEVGKRTIDQDLDLAFSLISSIEEVEKKNPDPTISDPIKTRERKTRGTLDLRVNPIGTRSWIWDVEEKNGRTTGSYGAFTPLFIDSKVSTGKITEDTLSLNRVVIGTQGEYRYIYDNSTYATYFRFIGRFSNASDRDFKQAEYKGTFEFRPVFGAFNHPLASIQVAQRRVIAGNSDPTNIYVTRTKGGYEIVPVFGGELGRTWSRRDPAEAVKPSDSVRRVYSGLEITLTPLPRTKLTLIDTFYYNFGTVTKRRANYFSGTIEFLLGEFADTRRAAHSVFVSFEKGHQPPFKNFGVNVVKIGYRIVGDRLFYLSTAR